MQQQKRLRLLIMTPVVFIDSPAPVISKRTPTMHYGSLSDGCEEYKRTDERYQPEGQRKIIESILVRRLEWISVTTSIPDVNIMADRRISVRVTIEL